MMKKQLLIYEDDNYKSLYPFTLNHATFELRVGVFTNLERILRLEYGDDYPIDSSVILAVRDEIKEIIKERYSGFKVISINDRNNYECTHINGSTIRHGSSTNSSIKINYLWDVFEHMEGRIFNDSESLPKSYNLIDSVKNSGVAQNVAKIHPEKIYTGKNITIYPGVVLDASKGPIIISDNVIICSNSVLEGPLFIDHHSQISPLSLIRGNTSIGPFCKIGGEVSCSIFQGYSNKVHHGFIGHSYIGEWVNIGAGTNNSNLKNNYADVKVVFEDQIINTKSQFMGVLIGDYTRIAIGTNLNTGTYISLGANIFNYNIKQKNIKPFSWGVDKKVNFEEFMITIRKMKKRRGKEISSIEHDFLKLLYTSLNKT